MFWDPLQVMLSIPAGALTLFLDVVSLGRTCQAMENAWCSKHGSFLWYSVPSTLGALPLKYLELRKQDPDSGDLADATNTQGSQHHTGFLVVSGQPVTSSYTDLRNLRYPTSPNDPNPWKV